MIYFISDTLSISSDDEMQQGTIEQCFDYYKDKKEIGFDLETMGFDPYTKEVIFAQLGDYENQFVFHGHDWLTKLKSLLESKKLLGHNLKFDLGFSLYQGIIAENVYDTYIAEVILKNGLDNVRKGLDHVVARYTDGKVDKSIRGDIHIVGATRTTIKYAADDVKYLSLIRDAQMKLAHKQDLTRAIDLNNLFVPVMAYLEYSGFKLDEDKWTEKIERDEETLNSYKTILDTYIIENNLKEFISPQLSLYTELFGDPQDLTINWGSPQQVVKFFKLLGVPTETIDPETGDLKDSVNKDILKKSKDVHPMVEVYMNFRQALKRTSTYGRTWFSFINPNTKRIHTQYKQYISTGRMSSGGKDKKLGIEWPNAQNLPSDYATRRCIVPEEGNILINADYSSQEVRIFANKSQDKALLEMFEKGLDDQHSFTAQKIYPHIQERYPEVTAENIKLIKKEFSEERTNAKGANFAIQYGGTGGTIANNQNIPVEKGKEIYDSYMSTFQGVADYFDSCYNFAITNKYIEFNNVTRGKYYIPPYLSKSVIKTRSYNYPVQGTAADMIKYAGVLFLREMIKKDWMFKVWITIICHDEYLLECPKDMAEEVAMSLKECMEKAADRFCPHPRIPAQPTIENYWTH